MHARLYAGSQDQCQCRDPSACAKQIITKIDLDGPVLCTEDPIRGGAVFNEKDITVSNGPGLGIKGIEKITYLD